MFILVRFAYQGLTEGTVDLHGLSVPEALEYAKQELQSTTLRDDRVVRFIVGTPFIHSLWFMSISMVCCWLFLPGSGKGLHSEAGKVKIRPALEQLCDEFVKILDR